MRNSLGFFLALVIIAIQSTATVSAQEVGDAMPPLHVTEWVLGDPASVGEWGDGTVYVVELWGTWCAPCIPMIPKLSAIQDRYRERGLVVIGYTWEELPKLEKFVSEMGSKMRYVVVNDLDEVFLQSVAESGSVQGFPYAYLINGDGTIAWKGHPKALDQVLERYYATR